MPPALADQTGDLEEGARKPWRLTREIPRSWRPPGGRCVRGGSAQLALKKPSVAEIYGRSARSVRPPLRAPRAAPAGQAHVPVPGAHLQNEPVYVSALRNPMWKSAAAAAQAEEDARQARLAQAEKDRLANQRANAQKEKRVAEEKAVEMREATRSGNWRRVQTLLDWRSPVEGFKVDVQATDSEEGDQEQPVMVAARQGHIESFIALVEAGAAVPQPDGSQRWEDDDESVMQKAQRLAYIRKQLRELETADSDAKKELAEGSVALAKAVEERDKLQQQLKDQEAEASKLSARQRRARRTSVEQMIEEYDIGADGIIDQLERKVHNAKKIIKSSVMPIATAKKRISHLTVEWHLGFPKEKPPPPRSLSPEKVDALLETYTTVEKMSAKNKKRWQHAEQVGSIASALGPADTAAAAKRSKNEAAARAAEVDTETSVVEIPASTIIQAAEEASEDPLSNSIVPRGSSVSATGLSGTLTKADGVPRLLDVAKQKSVIIPAAPVYLDAKQHRAGSTARTTKAVALAEANAIVSSRDDFVALKGPSHLTAWSASISKRSEEIAKAVRAEAAVTGRRAKIEEPAPPPDPHPPIKGPANPLRPGTRIKIAPTTISAWSGQLVRDANGIPRAFGVRSTPGTSPRRQPGFATPPLVRQRPATDGGSCGDTRRRRLHELQHDPAFLVDSITGERQQLGHGCTVPMWSPLTGGRRRVGSARSASSASSTTSSSYGGKLLTEQRGACRVMQHMLWS